MLVALIRPRSPRSQGTNKETELKADLVVIGSGIIPAVEYLKGADASGAVKLHDKAPGGLRVDETLKAGVDIYAAGACARHVADASHAPS